MGWCNAHSVPLRVPPDLISHLEEEEEAKQEAMKAVEEAQRTGVSVAEEALDVEGYTAVDRIKCGMKVEVWHDTFICYMFFLLTHSKIFMYLIYAK